MTHRFSTLSIWREAWRPALLCLAIIQGYLLFDVEKDRLEEVNSVKQLLMRRGNIQVYDPASDPKTGQQLLRLRVNDIAGRPITIPPKASRKPAVLVFVGECAPCVAQLLATWQRIVSAQRQVYVITQSDAQQVRRFQQLFKVNLPFGFDRAGDPQLRRYNVAWRPRAYLLDAEGHLLYIQPRWETSELARKKVLALIGNTSGTLSASQKGAS